MEQDVCPTQGRVPARLEVRHGPAALIGRYLLQADAAARERDVTLFFASFDDLLEINAANADTWRPLVPLFHPRVGGVSPRSGFVIVGRDASGTAVATQAARFYDWACTDLSAEATSLRMFYADPEAARASGARCEVSTPVAPAIRGRVVFSGAGWYRPDFRGRGLATILPRISRAYALTRWSSDVTISMIGDAVIAGGMAERTGYTRVERSSVDLVVPPLGALRCALVWMPTDELIADLGLQLAVGARGEVETARRAGGAER